MMIGNGSIDGRVFKWDCGSRLGTQIRLVPRFGSDRSRVKRRIGARSSGEDDGGAMFSKDRVLFVFLMPCMRCRGTLVCLASWTGLTMMLFEFCYRWTFGVGPGSEKGGRRVGKYEEYDSPSIYRD